jgi:hypothetical protein
MATPMGELVDKLCAASRKKVVDPNADVPWAEKLVPESEPWCYLPEWVTLHGTPYWDAMDEPARKKLAFLEEVNFFSINIHGERALIQGLAHRLYRLRTTEVTPYLHHFLDEENRHMMYFGRFCMTYKGRVYPEKKLAFPSDVSPEEEDLLFFVKVLVFEELVDMYNVTMGWDDRMHPIARQINKLHHIDEARHLIFGREVTKILFQRCKATWDAARLDHMRRYFTSYLETTWREYYNADVYRDAGLPKPHDVKDAAWGCEAQRAHRKKVSAGVVKWMLENELLSEEPAL